MYYSFNTSLERKHNRPLLDFIRFVAYQGKRARFPMRYNGEFSKHIPEFFTSELYYTCLDEVTPANSCPSSPPPEPEMSSGSAPCSNDSVANALPGPVAKLEEVEASVSPMLSTSKPPDRKRVREPEIEINSTSSRVDFSSRPFGCELVTKAQKGLIYSRYVDLQLSDLGLLPVFDSGRRPDKMEKKSSIDFDSDSCAQIVPDKGGANTDIEWVDFERLYEVPLNLSDIRTQAAERIKEIFERARVVTERTNDNSTHCLDAQSDSQQ